MTKTFVDELTQLSFSVYENRGVFALLLGSGVSRSAEIPTGWEITIDLIRRVALSQGVKDQGDWEKWYTKETGLSPDYSKLLEEIASTPAERRSILNSYIDATDVDREEGRKIPTPAHYAIADLIRSGYLKIVITTNFDRLLESALRDRGVEPTVVASVDALKGAEPLSHSDCYILKLHGDYKDDRVLNTHEELEDYPNEYNTLLSRIFDEYGLIICGWSGEWDGALRRAMLQTPNRRYPFYWATRSELKGYAEDLRKHRSARVIQVSSANKFFSNLNERVKTIEHTHRLNPQSVELAVSTAKRYISKPEYNIRLEQLFVDEAESLIEKLDSTYRAGSAGISNEEIAATILSYEAAAETIAKMSGVLGRWGNAEKQKIVLEVINSIVIKAGKISGGYKTHVDLRLYPAILIFTSYGLGLLRSSEWGMLHSFLTANIASFQGGKDRRIVDVLFLWSSPAGDDKYWKTLPGLEKRKTPLSDHLQLVFESWSVSFTGMISDYDFNFELFEMLATFAYVDKIGSEDLSAALTGHSQFGFFMPVGRSGWNHAVANKILEEISSEELRSKLMSAGFFQGSERRFDQSIENFRRVSGRMAW